MKKSIKISGLLSALLLAYGGTHAAGLGKLSVQSALGQPLKAEIELLSVTKDELSGVSARLASHELFRQARIDRSSALGALEFDVAQRANGQPVIRITSSAPMSDPFLDMLIELNWNTGRIIREYTILLDPPTEERTAQAVAVKPSAPASVAPSKDAASMEAAKPAKDAAKPETKPAAKAMPARYGPVKTGETLRSIAGRVKNPDVTLEQMMAGLYLTNKSAFIDNNMNLLKKGAVLTVPTAEAVHLQSSPSQARRMIQNHVEEWHAYRSKVAAVADEAPESRAEGQAAAGKIMPKVEDKTPTAAAPKDVLKLSKGEPAAGAKPDARTQERLQALEEELAAKSRALQESQDRVSQLERAVRDMQQLLELKSHEAAKPDATPAAPGAAQPTPPETAEPPVQEAAPPVKPKPMPLPPAPPAQEESSWLSTFLKNPLYIGGLVAAALLSGLLWMMMMGSRRRQGLNKFEDSIMTGGEFKSGAVFNTGGTGAATASPSNTEGSMLLTDFSRLGLGAIDTHEVDPIAEAEVYMAYGRDAQAEEILKEALEKDSSRHEIALKLLEIYAARKDPLAFETTASELYAGLGGQDTPVWQRAAEMGRSIDPDNPLYRMAQGQSFAASSEAEPAVAEAPAAEAPAAEADDFGLDFGSAMASEPGVEAAEQREAEEVPEEVLDENALDFTSSFDMPKPEEATEAEAESEIMPPEPEALAMDDMSMEFEPVVSEAEPEEVAEVSMEAVEEVPEIEVSSESLERVAEEVPQVIELELPVEEMPEEAGESLPELDLSSIDLDLEAEASQTAEAVEEEKPAAPDLEAVLEMPTEAEAEAPGAEAAPAGVDPALWEEVNTKLDLARAYLEMGDREGAREILQEVTQEGDDTQKAEANKLLSEAG